MNKEECLDRAAKEAGYKDWWDCFDTDPAVCKRVTLKAMEYAQLACLERAAERATASLEPDYQGGENAVVDKESITDKANLI